ncbi:MAG TPA: hypothetical protein VNN15_00140, partial [Solirubrobacterales bacterium]|nr:hypothetical protein [Solirubrobacterales bacterium]
MIRRALGAGMLALLLAAGAATAAVPEGPRLAVVKLSPKRFELLNVNPSGGDPVLLAGGGRNAKPLVEFFSPVGWSADGSQIAFTGILGFKNGDDHEPIRRLFTVGADGRGMRAIRGTNGATGPVFAPDGHTIAFTRFIDREEPTTVGGKPRKEFHGASIWIIDLLTGAQRQLTPWQDGLYYTASSFSPDGATLLATYEGPLVSEAEPVALQVDGSGSRRIVNDGFSPVYSPEGGHKIAFVRRIQEYG